MAPASEDVLVGVVGREHDEAGAWAQRVDAAHRLHAVEFRHAQIHEDHVGLKRGSALHRLHAVARPTDDAEVILKLQHPRETVPHDGVVVDDHDRDRVHREPPPTTAGGSAPAAVATRRVRLARREARLHERTASVIAHQSQRAAQQAGPLLHAGEPKAASAPAGSRFRLLDVEPAAVVTHPQEHRGGFEGELDLDVSRVRVLDDVRERLLADAQQRRLDGELAPLTRDAERRPLTALCFEALHFLAQSIDLPPENRSSRRVRAALVGEGGARWLPSGSGTEPRKIIGKLREAEVGLAQGQPVGQVVRKLGVSEQTYYRWRREYGGMKVDQAKRLKELERENAQLKKIVADQALDNAMLRELSRGNF